MTASGLAFEFYVFSDIIERLGRNRRQPEVFLRSRERLPRRIGEKAGYRRLLQGHRYREIREVRLSDDCSGRQVTGFFFNHYRYIRESKFFDNGFFFI